MGSMADLALSSLGPDLAARAPPRKRHSSFLSGCVVAAGASLRTDEAGRSHYIVDAGAKPQHRHDHQSPGRGACDLVDDVTEPGARDDSGHEFRRHAEGL